MIAKRGDRIESEPYFVRVISRVRNIVRIALRAKQQRGSSMRVKPRGRIHQHFDLICHIVQRSQGVRRNIFCMRNKIDRILITTTRSDVPFSRPETQSNGARRLH